MRFDLPFATSHLFVVLHNKKNFMRVDCSLFLPLNALFDCVCVCVIQEEEIPELEIDIDELLELSDEGQRSRLKVSLCTHR